MYRLTFSSVNNKDSFVLYVGSSSCSHCANFKPILEKVIKENYNMNGYESISAAYLYNKSKEKEEEYKLTLKNIDLK